METLSLFRGQTAAMTEKQADERLNGMQMWQTTLREMMSWDMLGFGCWLQPCLTAAFRSAKYWCCIASSAPILRCGLHTSRLCNPTINQSI